MMNDPNPQLAYLHHQLRQAELIRKANRERLAGTLERPRRLRAYAPALAALGRWMVWIGIWLQKRAGALRESARTPAQQWTQASNRL